MLLSKAITVIKELPGSTKDVGNWTYKDVDKLKMTDPDSYKLWHEAMKGEVKALDDRDVCVKNIIRYYIQYPLFYSVRSLNSIISVKLYNICQTL